MNIFILDQLKKLSQIPDIESHQWLETANQSVQFLRETCEKYNEIFLYANPEHFYVHSILVPRTTVNPPDHDAIENEHISPENTWYFSSTNSRGERTGVQLENPLGFVKSEPINMGEKLVFRRTFDGFNFKPPTIIEVSQKLVHALGLFYVEEQHAYCRLDCRGDIQKVISEYKLNLGEFPHKVDAITIRGLDLDFYMKSTDKALVIKFDFSRFKYSEQLNFGESNEKRINDECLYYRFNSNPNQSSYAVGHLVYYSKLNESDLIEEWESKQNLGTKTYVTFQIIDWKNDKYVETSCGPDHVVNYYENSNLPWEISPAFFTPDVLHKYKYDQEKYRVTDYAISCRGNWGLERYDINVAGQVHTYIGYLARLPYKEQLYWKSFNEWPKAGISERSYLHDILGKSSLIRNPLAELKGLIELLDYNSPDWWHKRNVELVEKLHNCGTDSIKEWSDEILACHQLVVEGFNSNGLRNLIKNQGNISSASNKSLKLLKLAISSMGQTKVQAESLVKPLDDLNYLRNIVKAHGHPDKEKVEVKKARKMHGNLPKHFQDLIARVRDSIKEISDIFQ